MQLHRLFAKRQRQSFDAHRLQPRGGPARPERGGIGRERRDMVEDQPRFHQRRSVVGDQGRRLEHGIYGAELIDVAEQGDRHVFEGHAEMQQGHRDAADIGRVEHADELHGAEDGAAGVAGQEAARGRSSRAACGRARAD